jgi:arylsulfatase B
MGDAFSASGYATAMFGKWHLGDTYPFRPTDRGFQHAVVLGGGGVTQIPDFWGNDYFDDTYRKNLKLTAFKGFCTDVFFDEAMKFIVKEKAAAKPFFVYLATNAPHGPMYCPDKFFKRFIGKTVKGVSIDDKTAHYYGMIENIDYNFGRLVSFLKKEGLYDGTILIFTTDNGPVTNGIKIFNAGLRGGKGSHFDGGHRVPFFISYPDGGIGGGVDIDKITAHIDILPTLIELCHLKAPEGVKFDGKSLAPLLLNPKPSWPDRAIVVENQRVVMPIKHRKFSVMTDRWRLTGDNGKFQLYDMSTDRGETRDVIKEHQELKERLLAAYDDFWNDVSREDSLFTRMVI